MHLAGHSGLALLAFAPFAYHYCRTDRWRRAGIGTGTVLALAMLPDVDLYLPGVAHRGITHTVWAALAVGALLALLGWRRHAGPDRRGAARFAFCLGVLSVLSHLAGDVLTPMGIRPFAPLVGTEYTLALVASRDPTANLVLLVAGAAAMGPSLGRAWSRAGRPASVRSLLVLLDARVRGLPASLALADDAVDPAED
ncbi:MAG: metal-dependent hydrolase [Haloarculaceae archaeon]